MSLNECRGHNNGDLNVCGSYSDIPEKELGLITGSSGFMEIARKNSSAASELGISTGYEIHIKIENGEKNS